VGDDGEYTGFDLDLAAAVAELEGWELQLEPIAWDAKDALLNSGQITCIWNGFTIEGREDDYAFTAPYMENRQVVVVRADSGIEDLEGLAGKIVLTQADSAALGLLEEDGDQAELGATFADLQTIGDYNTAFMMLETGSVDAVALDYPVAVFQVGDRADDFTILEEPLNSEHYGVGFAKGNEALAAAVEADLLKLVEDGTVEELCEKYADQGVSFDAWILGVEDEAGAAGAYADGVYEASGKGIGGTVPVTVTIEGGVITDVTVGDNSETQGIGSKAIEQLPELIVEANGTDGVDGVSGASVTSKAIFTAVEDCLEQAQA
jgi:polar amino acid transport system substrate-binding protein